MFFKGEDVIESEATRLAAAKEQRKNQIPLFWLKEGQENIKEAIVLDDDFISYYEHYIVEGNNWKDAIREVCIGESACPLCANNVKRNQVWLITVVDTSQWVDKQGAIHKNEKKIIKLNNENALIFKSMKKQYGGLRGKRFQILRAKKEDSNIGSSFSPMMKDGKMICYDLDAQAAQGKDVSPLDYKKWLAPKSVDELKKLVAHKTSKVQTVNLDDDMPTTSSNKPVPMADDDDVPF